MCTKKTQKNAIYSCEICSFITNNKTDFNKHLLTSKHQNVTNTVHSCTTIFNNYKTNNFICKICNKNYKSRMGLWYHKKKCILENIKIEEEIKEPEEINDLIIEMVKSNSELQKQNNSLKDFMVEQNQEFKNLILEVCKNNQITNNTLINNSNNKTFNLQFFLNEECKDAMNIMEFVDSLKLDLDDLIHVGKVGYINGISNIIIQNLKALDIYKRPVHCTDLKRETIYIKNNNVWEKETENNDLTRKSIKHIAKKNCTVLFLFKEKYPDCIYAASKYSDWYTKLTSEAFGGVEPEIKISENKIIKKILKEITLDKIKNNNYK